ncbi:MAG: hypothetical protein CMO01_29635 [Thalassobius sp.]|nr:hypothetical protein [Thalassovita sp.]
MRNLVDFIILIVLASLGVYLFQPTLSYGFVGLPVILLIASGLIAFKSKASKKKGAGNLFLLIALLSLLYITVLPVFTTWSLFRSDDYQKLIGEVKTGQEFSTYVAPISTEKIRIIDQSIANKLGDKVLGSIPSLGSQVDLGDFTIQKVGDKLYWVAPLLHSGYFKWSKNSGGTKGYVMVSATNERDVKLVQKNGEDEVRIKYQPNAFFFDNLKRHIYFNGYLSKGFTDFTFEIDDSGKPYWVVTLYDKKVGFSGNDATGVITVDTKTGEIQEYSIDEAPAWLDRIQPESFVENQLEDWGEYVKGFWNFANEDKLTTTEGISLVYGSNNRSYWYTGLTSVGSDEGTVGFVLVDTRTKEAVWYKQTGATEQAARQSAMGKVQEKRFDASFPITYNINGIPTYVMSLKDQAGLIKMIAMVSIEDYSVVGVGNDIKESLRAYKSAINSKGNALAPSSEVKNYEIETTVSRISIDTRNGNTYYYMILKNHENKIFVGTSIISNELPITEVNDKIKVSYDDGANEVVDIVKFDNLEFTLQKTEQQKQIEEYFEASK